MTGSLFSAANTPFLVILCLILVCVVGAIVTIRMRAVSTQLEGLSQAFDEQWRRIGKLQRSMDELTESISALAAETRRSASEQARHSANFSAESLCEELAGLQAELAPEAALSAEMGETP